MLLELSVAIPVGLKIVAETAGILSPLYPPISGSPAMVEITPEVFTLRIVFWYASVM